jgi:hypothetical protein
MKIKLCPAPDLRGLYTEYEKRLPEIDTIKSRLSELEDRMDSLMDTSEQTGSSDRLLTFSEAVKAMKEGRRIRRKVWAPGDYICAGNGDVICVAGLLYDDWMIVE